MGEGRDHWAACKYYILALKAYCIDEREGEVFGEGGANIR